MKKFLSAALSLLLLFGLVSCPVLADENTAEPNASAETGSSEAVTAETESAEATEAAGTETESTEAAAEEVECDLSQWGLPNTESYMVVWLSDTFQPIPLLPEYVGRKLSITTDEGTNIVEITERGFQMVEADCDDQLCITEGEVTPENRADRILDGFIVCLPHYLQLELCTRAELYELISTSVAAQ